MTKIATALAVAAALVFAPAASAAPTTPNPRPPHVRGHANPDLEHLCTQGWYVSNHYGLCLYNNS